MTFGYPWLLLLVAVPILLCVWEGIRRGLELAMPFDHSDRPHRVGWKSILFLAALLPPILLAITIAMIAAPRRFDTSRQERKLTNVEFVMDVSGSMESSFGDATRYDAAMASIEYFTKRRKGDAFGLTIFGNEVLRWTPLTSDVSALRNATPFLRPELLPEQFYGTEIGKAVKFCRNTLAERGDDGDRMIILLSDGYSADLGASRARAVGAELAADNIVIHAVHIGEGAAPSDLYELTRPTNGQVFAANHPESLIAVFDEIDRMKPVELKSAARQEVYWYQPLALGGLGVLVLYVGSLFSLRYTPW